MNNFSIRNLPIDSTNFEVLRKQNKIYIDKTDLIFEFAQDDAPIFLSRPRRFGKSLLTTTINSLFEHGLEYFEGLKISKLWNDTTYPVLYLNFSNYKENDYDVIIKFNSFVSYIHREINRVQIECDRLKTLRDSLLPKLMSGEIKV